MAYIDLTENEEPVDFAALADDLIQQIAKISAKVNTDVPVIASAIVETVHENGKVDVYFPPDNNAIITNVSNQSIHTLKAGDSVRILEPRGKTTDCWIIAKDG